MKAFIFRKYGEASVLNMQELPKPTPKSNEILVRVVATSVTAGDWRIRGGKPFAIRLFAGLFKPKNPVLGHEYSGVVEQVGGQVKGWKQGDEIFGGTGLESGTYSEYMLIDSKKAMEKIPEGVSFEEAAVVPVGFMAAYDFLKKVDIKSNMKVLIHGISGSVGSAMLQLLKLENAHVTGVCSSKNANWVKRMGADKVIAYDLEDVESNLENYDLIINAVGKTSFQELKHCLISPGVYIAIDAAGSDYIEWAKGKMLKDSRQIILGVGNQYQEDLTQIQKLLAKGSIRPYIDRIYSFEELPAAHDYVQKGRKAGNVAIRVQNSDPFFSQSFSNSAQGFGLDTKVGSQNVLGNAIQ